MRASPLGLVLAIVAFPATARSQGMSVRAGHLFDGTGMSSYQVGWSPLTLGPFGAEFGGVVWHGPAAGERRLGLTAEAQLFRGGRSGLYAVGGVGGGFSSGGAETGWRSWSAGLGYELIPLPFLSLGLESRWRDFQPSGRAGIEFSLRLGTSFRGSAPAAWLPAASDATNAAAPSLMTAAERGHALNEPDATGVLADVIRIAETQMGTPYEWGGTGRGDDGFDCSGLIQYAYRQAGISIPRQSRDQARTGVAVDRSKEMLQPGDILTFARTGRRITHVGLYIGDGRFIHSASRGVQISALGTDDPNGRWWYQRWIGVRRVVSPAP